MYRRTVNSMRPPLLLIAAAVVSVGVAAIPLLYLRGPHVVGRLERSSRSVASRQNPRNNHHECCSRDVGDCRLLADRCTHGMVIGQDEHPRTRLLPGDGGTSLAVPRT